MSLHDEAQRIQPHFFGHSHSSNAFSRLPSPRAAPCDLLLSLHGLITVVPSTTLREGWILVTADYMSGKYTTIYFAPISPRIELVVGEDTTSSEGSFLFPRELLRRRSRTLQERVKLHDGKAVPVPDTSVQTLTEFFIWSNRPDPHLEDRLTFPEVVDLGIFAWKYQISALSNQVTDKVRANLASGEWQLQAAIVDAIYQATEPGSPLREVVRAALGQLSRSVIAGEEWESTFRNNRDLGWDYLRAGDKEWARQDYLSGVCRFHNHDGITRQEGLCDGCPFAEADCYPDWGENTEQEFETSNSEMPSQPVNAAEEGFEESGIVAPEPVSASESGAAPDGQYPEPELTFDESMRVLEPMSEPESEPGPVPVSEPVPEPEPEPVSEPMPEPMSEPEPASEAEAAIEESTPEPASAETPVAEVPVEEVLLEVSKPVKVKGHPGAVEDVNGLGMNGHVDSEHTDEALEEADGTETPHVNGARAGSLAEEESLYPDSLSSDREILGAGPKVNGNMVDKGSVKAVVTAVPEAGNRKLSKNQRRKLAKKLNGGN
ncbi:hypothetical protein CLCR_05701 [Cladophialophora carrionii]|uniref:Uncharacterized protein n=1 Tax=Cladophialophora carrionii TaxID=86049 RepID=A0A1C1C6Y7_9EURO|nr:hypothetical protein CLCR_05701 [Cladophialophora carrionii]